MKKTVTLKKDFSTMTMNERILYMRELAQRMNYNDKARKNNTTQCVYLDNHNAHSARFVECFIYTDYKASNKFELWTATEIEQSDYVKRVSVHKNWELCYTYLVDRTVIEKLLKHIKLQHSDSDSHTAIVASDYMSASQLKKAQ